MGDGPAADFDIRRDLVAALLEEQHPDLVALVDVRLEAVAEGWDNAVFRLGDALAVRLPRRTVSVPLVEHEQRWLPELAVRLPLPVPAPVRVGVPGCGYPWPWSVVPWLAGEPAWMRPPDDPFDTARRLGGFLAALHQPAPAEAPRTPYRGLTLAERGELVADGVDQVVRVGLDPEVVWRRWRELAATTDQEGPALWLHGDVHPLNLLVDEGRLSGVLDFGDVAQGDRATDLSVAWMLLPPEARDALRRSAGADRPIDDATWRRAEAWALALGIAYVANDGPVQDIGRHVLAQVLTAAPQE
jgi:aminoglycoside phosphotransferase (APT) family kinase protein